jgi:hypothetical protein
MGIYSIPKITVAKELEIFKVLEVPCMGLKVLKGLEVLKGLDVTIGLKVLKSLDVIKGLNVLKSLNFLKGLNVSKVLDFLKGLDVPNGPQESGRSQVYGILQGSGRSN